MKYPVACLLAAIAVAGLLNTDARAADKKKILFVTQSNGFTHGSVNRKGKELAASEIAMTQLGQQTGLFEVHCTQNSEADLTKENLANYDIVMFYTTGKLPISEDNLDYFLNDWLKKKGHGFIGFHSATDTYKDYKPYWDMVGGSFNGHPWRAGSTVTIAVHEPDHPTMKPFGKEFQIKDEIYQYKNWQPKKVRVLMSLDMAKCTPSKPYHVPVAWVKSWGDGRVYVNNLGHNESTWRDKRFLESVTQGVKWVTGEIDGESKPNPELSAAQEDRAVLVAPPEEKQKKKKKKAA
jgi:type 1 glutamine amidotransferase